MAGDDREVILLHTNQLGTQESTKPGRAFVSNYPALPSLENSLHSKSRDPAHLKLPDKSVCKKHTIGDVRGACVGLQCG